MVSKDLFFISDKFVSKDIVSKLVAKVTAILLTTKKLNIKDHIRIIKGLWESVSLVKLQIDHTKVNTFLDETSS
ncbi:MAG TPA: hypothetical protein DCR43_07920 [Bacteroidales bacterium]|nr:MAG: hypothetical protein A2X09_08045 [Bacteroidetes bacterium GWF2_43_11]HAQ65760.1 hypothetical protein [Bacteroidales bacterium]